MLKISILKTISFGDRGPYVELMQLALDRAGFATSKDGIFGNATLSSLRAFQSANALTADGVAGRYTWNALAPYLLGFVEHTVRSGETFYRLSLMYSTGLRAIETANPNVDPFNIRTGSTLIIPFSFPVVPTDISFTPTLLEFCVAGLKARYPFISTGSIGKSVMGSDIYRLSIGQGANNVFYNASHHANEWITTPVLMKFFENYAQAYAFGRTIGGQNAQNLYRAATLHMVPMVNPDGVSLVTGEMTSGAYYVRATEISQNYPSIPFPSGWKANIEGVDLNLQYPAGWDNAREIKFSQGFVSPAPRDYVGTAPLSAPESRAVYNFTLQNNFSLTLSYHTQGRVIFWRYLDYSPENAYEIALKFSELSGYAVENVPYSSGFAGYKDWFILSYNRPAYTIEAGEGVSPLPLSQFDRIYADNEGILTYALTAVL